MMSVAKHFSLNAKKKGKKKKKKALAHTIACIITQLVEC
jgi:hypothetical protein